jgi:glucose-1-phosphate adenylyltransferase
VPFGGRYRIIDFVLSNVLNSGYRRIFVLTQFMSTSLIQHLSRNWHLHGLGDFIEVVPAQMRTGEYWYRGTADAVYQNLNLIRDERADNVAVFGGDHIYLFAVDQMEAFHREVGADATVAAIPVPSSEATAFGVIDVDDKWRVTGFLEKPANPPSIPGRPGWSLASMGNYFFKSEVLQDLLIADTKEDGSKHDFGRNIFPRMLEQGAAVYAYDFTSNRLPNAPADLAPYWRDVGTIDSFFEANMELRARLPEINLYNRDWRIRAAQRDYPPARFVRHSKDGPPVVADDSLVCEGSIVVGSVLREVLMGYDCVAHHGAVIEESLLFAGCDIGAGARLRKVILDKNCKVDPGAVIGYDPVGDAARFPFRTESGIVVLPKGTHVPAKGPIQLAFDIDEILRNDPDGRGALEAFEGEYTVSRRGRHSFIEPNSRYDRFAGAPDAGDPS